MAARQVRTPAPSLTPGDAPLASVTSVAVSASTETVALIASAGTAVGAVVGATAGGVVDLAIARASERRDAKAGARLVRADLAVAASQLREAEHEGKWWAFFNTRMDAWAAHRASLSARLDDARFEVVTQAVMELERFGADMKQAPLAPGASFRDVSASSTALRTMRENATAAYNALADEAEGRPVNGLLHE